MQTEGNSHGFAVIATWSPTDQGIVDAITFAADLLICSGWCTTAFPLPIRRLQYNENQLTRLSPRKCADQIGCVLA